VTPAAAGDEIRPEVPGALDAELRGLSSFHAPGPRYFYPSPLFLKGRGINVVKSMVLEFGAKVTPSNGPGILDFLRNHQVLEM
jgi:hypothetical protein